MAKQFLVLLIALSLFSCKESKEGDKAVDDSTQHELDKQAREQSELAAIPDPDTSGTGDWTANTRSSKRDVTEAGLLSNIRTSSSAAYDRIVFDFSGAALPNWRVAYIDNPTQSCGSGEPITLSGHGVLEISFTPCNAHDTLGNATMAWREKKFSHRSILEMKQTCDFEAVTTWAVGLRSVARYRVMELSDPPRIVVDIKN